ncbi:MAG: hypothetical protein WBQ02_17715, partial [Terracidiphilus sp.]
MPYSLRLILCLSLLAPVSPAQNDPQRAAPEKLGKVSFANSCAPTVQDEFNRGVALLHSFE